MVDYGYYGNTYLGGVIPQEEWEALGLRAQELLQWLTDRYTLTPRHPEADKLALCALAEYLFSREPAGLIQKTLGEVSLRYDKRPGLIRGASQAISPYYRIYRGVGL